MLSSPSHLDRFSVYYLLTTADNDIEATARGLAIEQTIETDPSLITREEIFERIVGTIAALRPLNRDQQGRECFLVRIDFWNEIAARQLPQLLNVIMGNASLKPGIKVMDLSFPSSFLKDFPGPAFGIEGIRDLLGIHHRPLLACPLKPMGLPVRELGKLAYDLAISGVDIIKDDHGLVNHSFCSFEDRIRYCHEAILDAAAKRGRPILYFLSITDGRRQMEKLVRRAGSLDQCGLLFSPFLTGLDFVEELVRDPAVKCPIMLHPAFTGSFFHHDHEGMHPSVLLGTLFRLAGGDMVIFPSFRGRFTFSEKTCRRLVRKLRTALDHLRPCLPVPAGGISLQALDQLQAVYGKETVYLIGSNLFSYSKDLRHNVDLFLAQLEKQPHDHL